MLINFFYKNTFDYDNEILDDHIIAKKNNDGKMYTKPAELEILISKIINLI